VMVRQAAAALDAQSPRATLTAAMAKRFATDTCFGVANDALQLLGGYGYLQVRSCVRMLHMSMALLCGVHMSRMAFVSGSAQAFVIGYRHLLWSPE
jgi:alkylation response protein AidB-like acyl-CoA dehydrogenase